MWSGCCLGGDGSRLQREPAATREVSDVDPNPDYDASDELEYGFAWWPWILRGVYPPPAYPPV
jgi:hypothetical protein